MSEPSTITCLWCPTCGEIVECQFLGRPNWTATDCDRCGKRRFYHCPDGGGFISTGEIFLTPKPDLEIEIDLAPKSGIAKLVETL